MRRVDVRIFHLNDQIAALRADEQRAVAELDVLMHLDDDAQRDAAVGGPTDRADAKETSADVERMRRHVASLQSARTRLEAKRNRLLARSERRR